ncbi:MAG: chemotaxis protein [Syntrophobacteraceae bacterium CG2_30_61_12]|nr:MAG: chemotaxis protein [Syntrophobacteraceae bacterium CG2_30_61_12]PIU32837.1 MAG: chemotaxis protein [Syntrophobacteraceae bacterium CG07_land_8_20_14_0_80_61_8]
MTSIDAIVKQIKQLEPLPQVTNRVMELVQDSRSSMNDLAKIVGFDQALTANILKVCNSAYFGLNKQVESVQQAIVYLGMDQVVDLVLMFGASRNLNAQHKGYDLGAGELWKYSVSSAILARELALKLGADNKQLIFTAALLKDIGKVVLQQFVAESFRDINELVAHQGYSFREAEKEILGIDHAELGGLVAKQWNFSSAMVEIIENHHLSRDVDVPGRDTAIVYLADLICMMMGIGVGSDGLAYRFHKKVVDDLGFSTKDLGEVIAGFGAKYEEVEALVKQS